MPSINKIKVPSVATAYDINDSRIPGIDSSVTSDSSNVVTSGGVKTALDGYVSGQYEIVALSEYPKPRYTGSDWTGYDTDDDMDQDLDQDLDQDF